MADPMLGDGAELWVLLAAVIAFMIGVPRLMWIGKSAVVAEYRCRCMPPAEGERMNTDTIGVAAPRRRGVPGPCRHPNEHPA